jgi:hypothetical protein
MRIISNDGSLKNWAKKIESEILSYSKEWFWPVDDKHKIFEQAKMIFINRNLNYFHLDNMITAVCEGDEYNSELNVARKFCGYSRTLTGDTGPFGRMCVWNLQASKELLPHVDAFDYHFNIVRNIFIISGRSNDKVQININGQDIKFDQGTMFQFSPATERHAFKNTSDDPFYFLGYDFWIPAKLAEHMKRITSVESLINDHDRLTLYGRPKENNFKYISKH